MSINKKNKVKKRKPTCKQREKRLKIIIYFLIGIIFILSISQIYILKKVNYLRDLQKFQKTTHKQNLDNNYFKNKNNNNTKDKQIDSKLNDNNDNNKDKLLMGYDENEKKVSVNETFSNVSDKDLENFKYDIQKKIKQNFVPYSKKYIVLILDDGGNKDNIKEVANLHFKINISIIPDLPFSQKNYNDIVKSENLFPMIHIPMEPKNSKDFILNKDFITLNDDYNSIYSKILRFKTQIPTNYANNHMGSLISENIEKTDEVLSVLKRLNIKFIDSKTSSKSKFEKAASKIGGKVFENNLFLDNLNNEKYIISNFSKGLNILNNRDYVIMIGHITKSRTIEFLKWLDKIEIYKYYNFITVEQLFQKFR